MKLIGTGHDRSYFSSIAKRPMAGFLNTGIASEVKVFTVIKNKIRKTVDMQINTHTHARRHMQTPFCNLQFVYYRKSCYWSTAMKEIN